MTIMRRLSTEVLASCHFPAAVAAMMALLLSQPASAQTVTKEKLTAALAKIEALAGKLIDEGKVPGLSIAVVFQDEVIYLKGFGVREEGKPDPVGADTVFQLASFSKPISSTVVAALVSDGTVTWDSRIADIDPAFKLYEAYPTEQVTLRDFFSHRSGLPGNAGNDLEGLGYDRDEILHRLRYVKPASSFRSAYSYSNFGLTEGGIAAARAAGMPWEVVAEEKVYKPLGMTSTSSRYADFVTRTNRAVLHVWYEDKWQALAKREPDAQAPAGGVSSNVRDLAEWMRLELGNGKYKGTQLIKEDAIGQTHVPLMERGRNPVTAAQSFYGLGWGVEFGPYGVVWGHAGAFSKGARTVVNLLPSENLGIVVLSNAFPTGVPDALASAFFDFIFKGEATRDWVTDWDKLYASLFGPASEAAKALYGQPPADATPALPNSAYVGTYANDYLGEAVIAEESGALWIKLGPEGKKAFPLEHFDRDRFTYKPIEEMPDTPSAITFLVAPDQKASQLRIEDLNDFDQGVLTRTGN